MRGKGYLCAINTHAARSYVQYKHVLFTSFATGSRGVHYR